MIDIAFDIIAIKIAKKVLLSIVTKGISSGIYRIFKKPPEKKVEKALRRALKKVAHDNEFWKNDVTRQRDDVLNILIKKIGGTETSKIKLPSYLDQKTVDCFYDCLKEDSETWKYLQELVRDYIIREIRDIALDTKDIAQDTNERVKNIENKLDGYNTNSSIDDHFLTSTPSAADASNVIGRNGDLEKLWEVLSEKKHVLFTGLGGIGKTKLAQMLFHKYRDQFEEVAWIDYKEDLKHSFLACVNAERFNKGPQNENERWEALKNSLLNDGKKKLFIIDNVDDDTNQRPENDMELRKLTGWDNTTILLTSRLDGLRPYILHELKALGKHDCKAVFNHYYGYDSDPELVGKIVKLANYHTLTIELLAKGARRENLESYYEKIKSGFEAVSRKMRTEHHDGNVTIEEHLKMLFDMQHRSDTDKKVLNAFAVLPVNCECTIEEIEQWFGFKNEDLDEVIKDGWLSYDEDKQVFSMHPLIRTIIRFDFLEDGQGKKTIAAEGTTKHFLAFIILCFNYSEICDGYASLQRRIDIAESIISAVEPSKMGFMNLVYDMLGACYYSKGDYDNALEYYEKALRISVSKLGKDAPFTAITYNNIAEVYIAKSDYDKPFVYYEKAKKIYESWFGKKHEITATIYNNLGGAYRRVCNYDKAFYYYEKALKVRESKLGRNHPDTASTYNDIAIMFCVMGDYDGSLVYYEKAKDIYESKLGKNHPDTATIYNNIGEVYHFKSNYDKALEYYEKAKEIRESKLGKDHPLTAAIYNNIAELYRTKSDYDKALEYLLKAEEIEDSKLANNHPSTATTYNNIAGVYRAKGDYDKALEYLLKALRIWLNRDDANYPNAKTIFENLAICYQEANTEKEMDEWMKEQLDEKEWEAYLELKGL